MNIDISTLSDADKTIFSDYLSLISGVIWFLK